MTEKKTTTPVAVLPLASSDVSESLYWLLEMADEALAARESGDDPEDTEEVMRGHRDAREGAGRVVEHLVSALQPRIARTWAEAALPGTRAYDEERRRGECHADALGVRLVQTGKDRFTVVYGKSVKVGLSYAQAATEYGAAVMHALAVDGFLDNRERGER